jgi:hypothetical protein
MNDSFVPTLQELIGAVRPGDMLLYIDPAREAPQHSSLLSPLFWPLRRLLAQMPFVNGVSGAAARSDWTSVAIMTLHANVPHIVTYVDLGGGEWEFCLIDAVGHMMKRRVTTFAVRPLIAHVKRDPAALRDSLLSILTQINALCDSPVRTTTDVRNDDVCLVAELYWRLTGASIASLEDGIGPRRSIAALFATGGALDQAMHGGRRQFMLGREIVGRLAAPPPPPPPPSLSQPTIAAVR